MSGPVSLPVGYTLVELASVASTNDEAARLASEGAADGTVVRARRQTGGRGRRGRRWTSPEGQRECSVVVRTAVPLARAAVLSLAAAVAVGDTVSEFLPTEARVEHKWPNDVLVDGAKIAGILLEASSSGGGAADWLVVGCGVNVSTYPDIPGLVATSLAAHGGPVPVDAVLATLLERLHSRRTEWETAGAAAVRGAWLDRARGLHEPIRVRLPREEVHGRFESLDDDGALMLRLADGGTRRISAGDVFFDDDSERG